MVDSVQVIGLKLVRPTPLDPTATNSKQIHQESIFELSPWATELRQRSMVWLQLELWIEIQVQE